MAHPQPTHETITAAILTAVAACGPGKTLCPSEVAKTLTAGTDQDWRAVLKPVRAEAIALAGAGRIGIYRKGKPVSAPADVKGVIRLGSPAPAPVGVPSPTSAPVGVPSPTGPGPSQG